MGNLYDKMEADVELLHKRIDADSKLRGRFKSDLNLTHRIFSRAQLYHKFIDSGFMRGWFQEFNEYWTEVLGGRPLKLHDFFYLHSSYRTRFQSIKVPDTNAKQDFLNAWQHYDNIFSVFSAVYRYALNPFSCFRVKRYVPRRGRLLEYGCGVAPVVTSMIRAGMRKYDYTVADIRNYTYSYAKYYLRSYGVKCVDIEPFELPHFNDKYDVILLLTVLEHLPDPLNVIEYLTDNLNRGGRLVFDYILSDGKGLDTKAAIAERGDVLDHLRTNYSLIHGCYNDNASMGLTVVEKK